MSALNNAICGAVVLPAGQGSATHKRRSRPAAGSPAAPGPVVLGGSLTSRPRVASSREARVWPTVKASNGARWECKASGPLKVIIAGAPASGKGTQCELIVQRFGLAHISAGDLLRAEVAAGTPAGKRAKDFMDRGDLVPDEVVITMVKNRLAQSDAQTKGWLLDGYPRSASQGQALEAAGIHPELFLLLEVPDEVLIQRVVGRRLDPVTGTIYHLRFAPPPPDVVPRLQQRSDDTEEKARNRLAVHERNVDAVRGMYANTLKVVDGNRDKKAVFADIEAAIAALR